MRALRILTITAICLMGAADTAAAQDTTTTVRAEIAAEQGEFETLFSIGARLLDQGAVTHEEAESAAIAYWTAQLLRSEGQLAFLSEALEGIDLDPSTRAAGLAALARFDVGRYTMTGDMEPFNTQHIEQLDAKIEPLRQHPDWFVAAQADVFFAESPLLIQDFEEASRRLRDVTAAWPEAAQSSQSLAMRVALVEVFASANAADVAAVVESIRSRASDSFDPFWFAVLQAAAGEVAVSDPLLARDLLESARDHLALHPEPDGQFGTYLNLVPTLFDDADPVLAPIAAELVRLAFETPPRDIDAPGEFMTGLIRWTLGGANPEARIAALEATLFGDPSFVPEGDPFYGQLLGTLADLLEEVGAEQGKALVQNRALSVPPGPEAARILSLAEGEPSAEKARIVDDAILSVSMSDDVSGTLALARRNVELRLALPPIDTEDHLLAVGVLSAYLISNELTSEMKSVNRDYIERLRALPERDHRITQFAIEGYQDDLIETGFFSEAADLDADLAQERALDGLSAAQAALATPLTEASAFSWSSPIEIASGRLADARLDAELAQLVGDTIEKIDAEVMKPDSAIVDADKFVDQGLRLGIPHGKTGAAIALLDRYLSTQLDAGETLRFVGPRLARRAAELLAEVGAAAQATSATALEAAFDFAGPSVAERALSAAQRDTCAEAALLFPETVVRLRCDEVAAPAATVADDDIHPIDMMIASFDSDTAGAIEILDHALARARSAERVHPVDVAALLSERARRYSDAGDTALANADAWAAAKGLIDADVLDVTELYRVLDMLPHDDVEAERLLDDLALRLKDYDTAEPVQAWLAMVRVNRALPQGSMGVEQAAQLMALAFSTADYWRRPAAASTGPELALFFFEKELHRARWTEIDGAQKNIEAIMKKALSMARPHTDLHVAASRISALYHAFRGDHDSVADVLAPYLDGSPEIASLVGDKQSAIAAAEDADRTLTSMIEAGAFPFEAETRPALVLDSDYEAAIVRLLEVRAVETARAMILRHASLAVVDRWSDASPGHALESVAPHGPFLLSWAVAVARTCAQSDGTDPDLDLVTSPLACGNLALELAETGLELIQRAPFAPTPAGREMFSGLTGARFDSDGLDPIETAVLLRADLSARWEASALDRIDRRAVDALVARSVAPTDAGLRAIGLDTIEARRARASARSDARRIDALRLDALDTALRGEGDNLLLDAATSALVDETDRPPLPVVAADLQAALRDGEALLHIGFEWGALITGDSIVLRRTSFDRRKLNNAIRTFVGSVATSKDSLAPVRLDLGHVIWESVMGPYTEALDGIDHIWLDLPGLLDQVPFEALVTEPPDTATWMPDSPEAPAWALRRFSFAYIPSLTSFHVLATLPQSSGDLALLGLGAPVLEGDAKGQISIESMLTDGRPDPDKLLRLAPLPHAAIELDSMAAAVGIDAAELIVGPDFVRSRMEAQPWDDARTIVFATHGLVAAGAAPLSHLLVLTPEAPGGPPPVLTPEDIRGQAIDSDLVVLSACDTGIVTDAIRQAGVSAFADSFMIAGARSVLVSRWPVLSDAVAELTVPVVDRAAELGSGHASRTMRRQTLAMIDDPQARPEMVHPATWGAFAVVGDVPPSRLIR